MASIPLAGPIHSELEENPLAADDGAASCKSGQICCGNRAFDRLSQEGAPAGSRQQLAHFEMESRPEEAGANSWTERPNEQNAEAGGISLGKQPTGRPGDSLPGHVCGDGCGDKASGSLAHHVQRAQRRALGLPPITAPIEHLEPDRSPPEEIECAPQSAHPEPPGVPTPAALGLPKNGDTFCFLLSCLALENNANWCYANAMCWAYGSCSSFQWEHFDCEEHLLEVLRSSPIGCTHSLEALFPILFSHISWGMNPADAAEFTAILHQRGCSQPFTAAWERRCEVSQKVTLHDHGSMTMPIVLQHTALTDHADFHQLLTDWSQELGMVAAFTLSDTKDPAAMMCCHIDRAVQQTGDTGVAKRSFAVNLDSLCLFFFFLDDGLDVLWYGCVPVAMLVHTGTWEGGHWRTAVRFHTQPLADAVWFVTDDNLEPMDHRGHDDHLVLQGHLLVTLAATAGSESLAADQKRATSKTTPNPATESPWFGISGNRWH